MEGFIKLHRQIEEWEWYQDGNTFRVFTHLLLNANHRDNQWRGMTVKRGQVITSYDKISKKLKLSFQQTRTALNHLKTTGEATIKTTNKFSLITLCNYDTYQNRESANNTQSDTQGDTQTTSKQHAPQQTSNKQLTTNKNDKKEKKKECKKVEVEKLVAVFESELRAGGRSEAEIVVLVAAWTKWIAHKAKRKEPVTEEMARRDAGRCCGLRTQRRKISPPRGLPPTSVLVELMDASMCEGSWRDWFYDDAFERLMADERGEKIDPPRGGRRGPEDDPFGNGGLRAPSDEF